MLKNTDKHKCAKRLLYIKVVFDTNIIVKNFRSHNNKFFFFSFVKCNKLKLLYVEREFEKLAMFDSSV